ncbi:phage tail family protein [Enterococcus dispar]|uniref:phage tail family protein n=1 Tax=Enterococcus dispar TaxID=44009 RepID=UPI0021D42C71|nr:phage tail family protein [Enterococcus dispar]MCU7356522.1 phage tail family protein [Enterococcus dispar]
MSGYIIDLRFFKNFQLLSLKEILGVECIEFERKAPALNVEYQEFSGSNGSREVNSSFKSFVIEVKLFMEFKNMYDYQLKETELYAFLFDDNNYYIVTDREPGKRYLVRPNSVDLEDLGIRYATYSVAFNVFKGCSESLSTTLKAFSLDETWQFSQGLVSEDYEYTHQTSRFTIFNAGDFTIDPRENYLKIKIEGMSDGNLAVFNATTGERFIYRGSLNSVSGETLTLDGVYPLKNGIHCGIDTNHGLISLVPGENKIEISNVSRIKTSWDFRFLYK